MVNDEIFAKAAIDRELGLDRYEGDEKIYENVLENFDRNNKNTLKELHSAIDAKDIKLAHRIAHSLRGASGTIGATRLADAAFHVERLLSPTNAESAPAGKSLESQIASLESEYNAVFDELKLLVKEDEKPGCNPLVMSREKALDLIDRLTPILEAGDAKSLEYLDEIAESFRPVAERINLFITQMENYDFEQAFETMTHIRQFMSP